MRNKILKLSSIVLSVTLPFSVVISCSNSTNNSQDSLINKMSNVFKSIKGVEDPYVSTKYTMLPSTFTLGNITPYTIEELGIDGQIDFKDLNYKIFIQSIDDELGTIVMRIYLTHPDNDSIKMVKVSKVRGYYATRDIQDEIDLTTFMSTSTSSNYTSSFSDTLVSEVYNTHKSNAKVRLSDIGVVSGVIVDSEGNNANLDVTAIDWTGYTYEIKLIGFQDYEDRNLEAYIQGQITVTRGNIFKKRDFRIKGYQSTYDILNAKLNNAETIMTENQVITTSKTNTLATSIGQPGNTVTQDQLGIHIPIVAGVTYRLMIESVDGSEIVVRYRLTSGALPARTGSILVTGYRATT